MVNVRFIGSATENSSNSGYYTDINIDEIAPVYIENLLGYPVSSGTPSWDSSTRTITLDKDYSFLLIYCQKYQSYRNSQSELDAASPLFSNNGYQMPADCVYSQTNSSVARGSVEYFSNVYYFILKDVVQ